MNCEMKDFGWLCFDLQQVRVAVRVRVRVRIRVRVKVALLRLATGG